MTLITGSKRLLMAGDDDDEMYMTRSLNVTPETAERHLIARSDKSRHSLYRAANGIYGRIGRIATEDVILHLLQTKCVPISVYGLEACLLRKTDLNSLDFVVNRFFMKLFQTNNMDIIINLVSRTSVFNCPVLFSASVLQNLT